MAYHTCYMGGGSIINAITGSIIERPAVLVSKEADTIHGWGDLENVKTRFDKFCRGYSMAGMTEELNDLMLIELSEYKISREKACYVLRRMTEFTATGFIREFCKRLMDKNLAAWLDSEMARIPIDTNKKEW